MDKPATPRGETPCQWCGGGKVVPTWPDGEPLPCAKCSPAPGAVAKETEVSRFRDSLIREKSGLLQHAGYNEAEAEVEATRRVDALLAAVRAEEQAQYQAIGETRYIVVNRHGEENLLDRDIARTGALVVCAHRDTHNAVDAPHTLKAVRVVPLPKEG